MISTPKFCEQENSVFLISMRCSYHRRNVTDIYAQDGWDGRTDVSEKLGSFSIFIGIDRNGGGSQRKIKFQQDYI